MRHIGQLVCNGHAISELRVSPGALDCVRDDSFLPSAGLLHCYLRSARVFTAIYPRISMFNHDCDPNIRNHFERSTLKVYATRAIAPGCEIVNCYGPNYRLMPGDTRRILLRNQYCFDCDCNRCRTEDDTFLKQFNTIRCPHCGHCFVKELNFADLEVGRAVSCPWCSGKFGDKFYDLLQQDDLKLARYERTWLRISALYEYCTKVLVDCNQTKADVLQDILHSHTQHARSSRELVDVLRKYALELVRIRRHQFGYMSLEFLTGCFYLLDLWAVLYLVNGEQSVQLTAEEATALKEFRAALSMVGEENRALISEYIKHSVMVDEENAGDTGPFY